MRSWLAVSFATITTFAVILTHGGNWSDVRAQTDEQRQPIEMPELPANSAIVNPEVPSDELAHLLVPLTAAELEATAKEWLQIVASKTEAIATSISQSQ